MSTLFVSYAHENESAADNIICRLETEGYTVFFDRQMTPGTNWSHKLNRRLQQCQGLVAVVSEEWQNSRWCLRELAIAESQAKKVFPVIIDGTSVSKYDDLRRYQAATLDFDGTPDYTALITGLREHIGSPENDFTWDESRPPYPGLPAFEEADARIFFGREDAIKEVRARLDAMSEDEPCKLLLITGNSGSGKSSLMRAGIAPRLRTKWPGFTVFMPIFRGNDMARAGEPWEERLAKGLHAALSCAGGTLTWREILSLLSGPDGVSRFIDLVKDHLHESRPNDSVTPVLLIDQFEELLQLIDNDKAESSGFRFLRFLGELLTSSQSTWRCIATVRSDYLHLLKQRPELQDITQEYWLKEISRNELFHVIQQPAQLAGIEFESAALVSEIVDDAKPSDHAKTSDALPLLAFVLRELYDRFVKGEEKRLTLAQYRTELGGLNGCLKQVTEECLRDSPSEEINAAHEEIVKSAFVSHFAQLDKQGKEFVRRTAKWDKIPAAARPILQRLVNKRLLRSFQDQDKTEQFVEVTHEALFRVDPVQHWLEASRPDLQRRQDALASAEKWQEHKRHEAYLMHRKDRLNAALSALKDLPDVFMQLEREYLHACREQSQAEQRRTNFLLGGLISLLVISLIGAAAWGISQSQLASQRNETIAGLQEIRGLTKQWTSESDKYLALYPWLSNVRLQFLDDAGKHYDRLAEKDSDDPAVLLEQAFAMVEAGKAFGLMREFRENAFEESKARFDKADKILARIHDSPMEFERQLAIAECSLAHAMMLVDQASELEQPHEECIELYDKTLNALSAAGNNAKLIARVTDLRVECLLSRAEFYLRIAAWDKASQGAQEALQIITSSDGQSALPKARELQGRAHTLRGQALFGSGQREAALKELQIASDLVADVDPNDTIHHHFRRIALHNEQSRIFKELGLTQEALDGYQRAIRQFDLLDQKLTDIPRLQFGQVLVFNNLSQLLQSLGRSREAQRVSEYCSPLAKHEVNIYPDDMWARVEYAKCCDILGQSQMDLAEDDAAHTAFKIAIDSFDKLPEGPEKTLRRAITRSHLAQVLEKLDHDSEAVQAYTQSASELSTLETGSHAYVSNATYALASVRVHFGEYHFQHQAPIKALEQFQLAVECWKKLCGGRDAPADYVHQYARLLTYCPHPDVRDPQLAVELAKQACEMAPENASYRRTRALAHLRLDDEGESRQARAQLQEADRLADQDGWHLLILGMVQAEAGNQAEASDAVRDAREWMQANCPDNPELKRLLVEAESRLASD